MGENAEKGVDIDLASECDEERGGVDVSGSEGMNFGTGVVPGATNI